MDSTKDEMAAFGLFHVAFTDLDTHIAAATFEMCAYSDEADNDSEMMPIVIPG